MNECNIYDAYNNIKITSKNKIWTNIYSLNPLETLKNLESKNCSVYIKKNALVLVERDCNLEKVHFILESCDHSMDIFNEIEGESLILELIEDSRNINFIDSLSSYGFNLYASLMRMTLNKNDNFKSEASNKIDYANLGDVDSISILFRKYFNSAIDRIPSDLEIEEQIRKGLIICFKAAGSISAFASMTLNPGASNLNHIFVIPEFRGQGIAKGLFESFLSLATSSRVARLWVLPDNEPAILMYQKYNFEFDGLKNHIYKK